MYKHVLVTALTVAAIAAAAPASAQIAPHDLEVTGTLRTPTCTVTAQSDGIYDFERISSTIIPASGHKDLAEKSMNWSVDCGTGSTFMVFRVVDNREDSVSQAANTNFGLGNVNSTGRLGYYTVEMRQAQVDGVDAQTLKAGVNAASGTGAATTLLDKTMAHSWTDGTGGGRVPTAGSTFSSELVVKPYLANSTLMNGSLTQAVDLDGLLTLSYSFGL